MPRTPALNQELLDALLPALAAVANAEKAPWMKQYMKSAMPYLGVPQPVVRKTVKDLVKSHPFGSAGELAATAGQLWRSAEFREQRHAAIMMTDSALVRGQLELLPLYQEFIADGAWWDYVDSTADRIWQLLRAHPEQMAPVLREWMVHPDFWFRRSAIIAQLPAKAATDTALLAEAIEANMADAQFFVRKAIGWALRQYARTDAAWVSAFVAGHRNQLSPLSVREALKHIA